MGSYFRITVWVLDLCFGVATAATPNVIYD